MKQLLTTLLLLGGCASFDSEKTIAGGAEGSIDYCIRILGNEALCINAERKHGKE